MKKYILIFSLLFSLVVFTGCYTVIWSPDMDLPTVESYEEESYYDDGYYPAPYYGDYGYYYQYPWWLTVPSATYSVKKENRDENSTMERIRNRDGSRDTPDRGPIISNTPVTKSGSSGSSGSSNSGSSGSQESTRKSEVKKESTGSGSGSSSSGSSSSGSSSNTRSSSGNDSNNTRNNDGGRNNGGRK